jgi:cell division initiation protein
MALTPVEVRHLRFPRRPSGYARAAVDEALAEVVESFETVWRERADLADKVEQLESDLVRYRELETLLRTTLVSAERAAHELKAQAKKESDLVLQEARGEAREILRRAGAERERLDLESRRIRTQLESALEALQTGAAGRRPEAA